MIPWQIFIQTNDDECFIAIPVSPNLMVKPSELKELMPLLEKYINEHTDEEVEEENKRRLDNIYGGLPTTTKKKAATYSGGYVYLFECGGKYKIGVSQNVSRRIKDLDNRPFKVNLICKVYSKMAYKVESMIHKALKIYKIDGEWYDFDFTPTAERFETIIKKVEKQIEAKL